MINKHTPIKNSKKENVLGTYLYHHYRPSFFHIKMGSVMDQGSKKSLTKF